MRRPWALVVLIWRFAKSLVLSGWDTGRIILTRSEAPHRGLAHLDYGDLHESGAILLGALVTLTPGTSLVDIDTQQHRLLLHLLDKQNLDRTLASIRQEFLEPIRILFGSRS